MLGLRGNSLVCSGLCYCICAVFSLCYTAGPGKVRFALQASPLTKKLCAGGQCLRFQLCSMKSLVGNSVEPASPSRNETVFLDGQSESLGASGVSCLDRNRVRDGICRCDLAAPVLTANRANCVDCFAGSPGFRIVDGSSGTQSLGNSSLFCLDSNRDQDGVSMSALASPVLACGRANPINCCIAHPELTIAACQDRQVLRSSPNRRLGRTDHVAPYSNSFPKQISGSSPAIGADTPYAENMTDVYSTSMTSPKATLQRVLEPPGAPKKKKSIKSLEIRPRSHLSRAACRRLEF